MLAEIGLSALALAFCAAIYAIGASVYGARRQREKFVNSGRNAALLTFPLLLLNMGWIAVCVALVGARFPDTSELIGTILVLGLLLTPILWPIDKFPADSLRGVVVRFNPAFHMIDVVRAPVLGQAPEPVSIWIVCAMVVVGWLFTVWLFRRYARFVPLWV